MRSEEILKKTEEGIKESNKILIQELVKDLEQKGIQPVISMDGVVTKLKIADEDEVKDCKNEVKKAGLNAEDFCLMEEDNKGKFDVEAKIIVVYKKSGKLKQYRVGHNSHWIADFHRDLQNKFFTS